MKRAGGSRVSAQGDHGRPARSACAATCGGGRRGSGARVSATTPAGVDGGGGGCASGEDAGVLGTAGPQEVAGRVVPEGGGQGGAGRSLATSWGVAVEDRGPWWGAQSPRGPKS